MQNGKRATAVSLAYLRCSTVSVPPWLILVRSTKMANNFEIDDSFIAEQNGKERDWVAEDYEHLGKQLRRRKVDVEDLVAKAQAFRVAVPSWGVGTGGTRFARFAGAGEPRDIYEKLEDCGTIFKLVRSTPAVSLHIPWDRPDDATKLRYFARARGLQFDAMNSN